MLAAAWSVVAGHALLTRLGGLPSRLPGAWADASHRDLLQSGDEPYQGFLDRTASALPTAQRILVLAFDPQRNDLFQWYRAAFVLFPRRVWYVPVGDLSGVRKTIPLKTGPELAGIVQAAGIAHAAFYHHPDPARSSFFSVKVGAKGDELLLTPLVPPAAVAVVPPPSPAAWRWLLGLALLLIPGLALAEAVGLGTAFADALPGRLGLGFLLGAGGTAWLMQALSLAGVRWSLQAILLAWSPFLLVGGWRWGNARRERAAVAHAPVVSTPRDRQVTLAGQVLLGLAAVLALVEVSIPVSAWGNWDAWAIWGLKAKACWEAHGLPTAFLGEAPYRFAHPDYPNGLPSVQCYLGLWAGGLDERLLRLLPWAHFLALLGILVTILDDLGAGAWRWLAAGALALTPKVLEFASIGYGDLPVAAWSLAGLAVTLRAGAGLAPLWTVALVGGLSTLVKDEGLIWAVGCLLVLAAWAAQRREAWGRVAVATVVLVLIVAPWKAYIGRLGIKPNDYVINPAAMLAALPERLPLVLKGYALEAWGPGVSMPALHDQPFADPFGESYGHLRMSFALLWYAIPLGFLLGLRAWLRAPRRELLLPLAVQAAGYLAVYLASLRDIPFHLVTTADRVLLQLSPAAFALAAGAALAGLAPATPPPAGPATATAPPTRKAPIAPPSQRKR